MCASGSAFRRGSPGDDRHEHRTIPVQHIDQWDFGVIDRETEVLRRTEDDLLRVERAAKLWAEGRSPYWTAAEAYLHSRALVLTDDLADSVLRFHPRCPWRDENTGRTEFIPCVLAAFRSIDNGTITTVHRVRLD
jgi:hypothetical protein